MAISGKVLNSSNGEVLPGEPHPLYFLPYIFKEQLAELLDTAQIKRGKKDLPWTNYLHRLQAAEKTDVWASDQPQSETVSPAGSTFTKVNLE